MEKAKEFLKNRLNAGCGIGADFERKMEGLKPEINNLLHMYLPDDLTLREVEELAMCINDMIWHPRQYLPHKYPDAANAKPPSL